MRAIADLPELTSRWHRNSDASYEMALRCLETTKSILWGHFAIYLDAVQGSWCVNLSLYWDSLLHRNDNLFRDLDSRALTADEEDIIAKRVALQRRMLEEYERRERARKVPHSHFYIIMLSSLHIHIVMSLGPSDIIEALD